MTFAQPLWLLLLPAMAVLVWRQRRVRTGSMRLPGAHTLPGHDSWRIRLAPVLPWLPVLAIGLLLLALARPQRRWQEQKITADAVDIVLSMDLSPSMLSRDFAPDRLEVAKRVAIGFVEKRPYDRLGLVAFSGEAFTQCPLTTDRRVVQTFIRDLRVGLLSEGTAIGVGLATAVNRLKDSPARSKVVILLTDGENNTGQDMPPLKAAEIAEALGVKVYTVGIGTEGVVMSPVSQNPDGSYEFAPRLVRFDTDLLSQMARRTGGKFYRAFSEEDLSGIYAEIDRLEKTTIEVSTLQRHSDWFPWVVGAALLLLLLEMLLRRLWLRSLTEG
ncbi:MAG TPA: VWA domain-containing protein [Saprospiraceae bacterium]|nr:VWA domain-containing protein [Saprospiraceae bacterium]HNG89729.1 VWA domain-containing protein [Saprospiraceae bacterium]